jgi:phage tail tube protein FII
MAIPTIYHARYQALMLQKGGAYLMHRYLRALASARIDLHPHQIEAALFASAPTFAEGTILADEEGLGKTITAGIVLLDSLINGKKNLLVLCPRNLIPHWTRELNDKFDIDIVALGSDDHGVVLMSYTDAVKQADKIAEIKWDLCVLDEAHILANAFSLIEYDPDVLTKFGVVSGNSVAISLRGALVDDASTASMIIQVRGMFREIDMGKFKAGDKAIMNCAVACRYYSVEIDGKKLIEIDIDNMTRVINGEDKLSEIRAALGI